MELLGAGYIGNRSLAEGQVYAKLCTQILKNKKVIRFTAIKKVGGAFCYSQTKAPNCFL